MRQLILVLIFIISTGAHAQYDDMYFVPKKKDKVAKSSKEVSDNYRSDIDNVNNMDVDVYNRRVTLPSDYEYNEDVIDDESESEEYVTESIDDADYEYSSRIVRFHSPRKVIVSSPWYWDVVYTSGSGNWVIYDDGIFWDLYPSYYSSWHYPHWSWNFSLCGGWSSWHFGYHDWWHYHHHYHHYHPWWDWHHNGHFVAGGPGFRNNRIPPMTDMRSGRVVGRGDSRVRGNVTTVDRSNGSQRRPAVNGNSSSQRRPAVSGNSSSQRRPAVSGNSSSQRRPAVNGNSSSQRRRPTADRNNGSHRRSTTDSNMKSKNSDKTYNRPSSTRNTDVDRSSTRRNSSGSFDRSSRSGGSRGGMSGGSRGGGSRGGRR